MPYPLSFELQPKIVQGVKQLQRLIMTRQMQQAIHLLQMPVMELLPAIELELEQNPILEYLEDNEEQEEQDAESQQLADETNEDPEETETPPEEGLKFDERDFEVLRRLDEDFRDAFTDDTNFSKNSSDREKQNSILENTLCAKKNLFEHLMEQAHEAFENDFERRLAEALIGSIDDKGFLTSSLQEIAVLQNCSLKELEKVLAVIQTFHPVGVGGRDLQEALLIQLRHQGKQDSLAYTIIANHFDDLLHNRIPKMKKALQCTAEQIDEMIDQHIAKLDLHPGTQLDGQPTAYMIPDVTLRQEGENLIPSVNDEAMPRLRLNRKYMRMMDDASLNKETKEFIRHKVVSAKWLLRNILQRNDTLERIATALAKHQREYFLNPDGQLVPLTMKMLADELEVHESTVARAVSNKYIETPRGLFPLRFFFTNALSSDTGDLSTNTVRDILQEIISNEDKSKPLSDEAIAALMKEKGIRCARRTVAKYRGLLSIGSAQQRRKFL